VSVIAVAVDAPKVGNYDFAVKFNDVGVTSSRIVDEPDLIPKLPIFGFSLLPSLVQFAGEPSDLSLLDRGGRGRNSERIAAFRLRRLRRRPLIGSPRLLWSAFSSRPP
jgi:hypothetical protein